MKKVSLSFIGNKIHKQVIFYRNKHCTYPLSSNITTSIVFFFFFSGCASITGSKNQPISVVTISENGPVNDARCVLTNDKGQWFIQTPGSVVVQKSTEDLSIVCKKEKHSGNGVFQSKSNGGVWGNIVVGGLIGYAVDSSSGAGFDYPSVTTVSMIEID